MSEHHDFVMGNTATEIPFRPKNIFPVCSHPECPQFRDESFKRLSHDIQTQDKPFNNNSAYRKHMRDQHNESLYPCDVEGCPRKGRQGYFREKDLLNHHQRAHSEVSKHSKTEQDLSGPPTSSSPRSSIHSDTDTDKAQSRAQNAVPATAKADSSTTEMITWPALEPEDYDSWDDEWHHSGSEDDLLEAHWVPTDGDFEADVLRATGNNAEVAARLMEQLHDIFRKERSLVLGFWQAGSYKRAGNPGDSPAGTPGDWDNSHDSPTGQNSNDRQPKRQKMDGGKDGQGGGNNPGGGNGGGDRRNSKAGTAGTPYSIPLACPFNKRDPRKYCGSSRSPAGKNFEYRTCETPFYYDQRFK